MGKPRVCLIQVPYMIGDERQGGSQGALRLVQAGVDQRLADRGIAVNIERVERGQPFRDSASASLAVNSQLATIVRKAITAGQLPLVLAGSCDVGLGILAGFDLTQCGVVWLDAHGDFNTPDTTVTGFFAGMTLAVITGHCYRHFWAQIGNNVPVAEDATLLLGVRNLDPLERERLERSAIQYVSWSEGKPQGDVLAALDRLSQRVPEVYLHIDLDALDPSVAPGIVDEPVPGGLSLEGVVDTLHATVARLRIRAAALTTYNPDQDEAEQTLQVGLHIIEMLAASTGGGVRARLRADPNER